ncbi:6-phosphogluconate dehydrogenase C-terminal domain-like protein [Exidia glandulosa HHB12029]|uniref:6-phosphogluconate dehydrogenase C-terminal domain-like protein n=1 Tax=Exidia glandulosa HHB12029 TaxID=1314781 RepID=A0A165PKX8_EXIGL|nr:6-phosphogluconate dehydrogenase C-terminal domain-like protein [Exidia glandulosa HHB12029]
MLAPTIGIISAGAMGAGIAARLTAGGCTVLTDLGNRSASTRKRAQEAGMLDASLSEICTRSHWILSILPPSDARSLAQQFLDAGLDKSTARYVDCNAISPETTRGIAQLLKDAAPRTPYLDAGIIGGPPKGDYEPALYASAEERWEAEGVLQEFGQLKSFGLPVKILPGAGVGGASALKLSYAGIMKGLSGLMITMILSAHADSPATADALMSELAHSGPSLLARSELALKGSQPKAYRFVGEMEEIAAFIDSGLGDNGPGQIFEGMAKLYARLAESVKSGKGDVEVLDDWVDKVKKMRE